MKTYLGDGLYAEFDGFGITLKAPKEDGEHTVYLEPDILYSFIQFVEKAFKRKIVITNPEQEDEK